MRPDRSDHSLRHSDGYGGEASASAPISATRGGARTRTAPAMSSGRRSLDLENLPSRTWRQFIGEGTAMPWTWVFVSSPTMCAPVPTAYSQHHPGWGIGLLQLPRTLERNHSLVVLGERFDVERAGWSRRWFGAMHSPRQGSVSPILGAERCGRTLTTICGMVATRWRAVRRNSTGVSGHLHAAKGMVVILVRTPNFEAI